MNCRDLSTLHGTDSSPGNGCRTTCPIEDFGRGNRIFNMHFKSYFANQYPPTSVFQYDVANRFTGRYMVNKLSAIAWNYITFYVAPRLQNPCLNIAKKETIRNKGRWYMWIFPLKNMYGVKDYQRYLKWITQNGHTIIVQLILMMRSVYIDGLVQDCSNSIANALGLPLSCTKPSI